MSFRKNLPLYLGGLLFVAATSVGVALMAHGRSRAEAREADMRVREVAAGPHVFVAVAKAAPTEEHLELQAEARAFAEVTLYAKISGYLKTISVDKGDSVKPNQVIAIIESPELDRQLDAAVADADFKRSNARRSTTLAKSGFIAPRDAEQDTSLAVIAEANVAAMHTQKAYEQLRAPFAGTVTARYADPGALVQSAANAQSSALPVVTIAQIDRLRVYAYVDQRTAALVHVGDPAEVSLLGAQRTVVPGKVARLSNQLDVHTRTMLVEVDLDNHAHLIVPGSFVSVTLTIQVPKAVEVPVEALVMRGKQTFMAKVSPDEHILFRPVTLVGNDGAHVRISTGLEIGEAVALNIGDTLPEGAQVQAVRLPAK